MIPVLICSIQTSVFVVLNLMMLGHSLPFGFGPTIRRKTSARVGMAPATHTVSGRQDGPCVPSLVSAISTQNRKSGYCDEVSGGELGGLGGGVPVQRAPCRDRKCRRRRLGIAGAAVVPGDLRRVGVVNLQGPREQAVQPAPVAGRQRRRDRFGDEVVRGRPAVLAEPHEPGRGQPGQCLEDGPAVRPAGAGQRARRRLPGQQRQ